MQSQRVCVLTGVSRDLRSGCESAHCTAEEFAVTQTDRILIAVAVVAVDLLLFALPLTGILAAYLVLARPPWFREFVDRLYQPDSP